MPVEWRKYLSKYEDIRKLQRIGGCNTPSLYLVYNVYKNDGVVVSLESIITLQIWALGGCLNETEGGLYISPPTDQRHVSRLMDLSHMPLSVSKK